MTGFVSGGAAGPDGERRAYSRWYCYRPFAAKASSVPGVRGWVRECLARAGVGSDTRMRAELIITELAANAVQHAEGRRVMVSVRTDGHIEAAVRDEGSARPVPRRAGIWDTGGRGLALVAALADEWGSTPAAGGKWVWFRLDRALDRAPDLPPDPADSAGGTVR